MENPVYENDYYRIEIDRNHPEPFYKVINKAFNIVEYDSQVLPKAILTADEYNTYLKSREAKPKAVTNEVVTPLFGNHATK